MTDKRDAGTIANDARIAKGLKWEALAESIDRPAVWTVAAVLGSHPMPADTARAVTRLLDLNDDVRAAFQRQPYRIADETLKSDPTVYRFHELLHVYGTALKELIHEEFGDGIMSAINCNVNIQRREDPDGDRVVVTIDGKFLPYHW
jgi:cyanate lyase